MATEQNTMDLSQDIEGIFEEPTHRYQCEECVYGTSDRSNFNRHVRSVHAAPCDQNSSTSTPKQKCEKHVCAQCGRQYKSIFGLNLHVKKIHEKTFKHTCPICDAGYNQSVQYRYHMSQHTQLPIDTCSFCNTEFKAPGSLTRHLKVCPYNPDATDECPHVCDQCGAKYKTKTKLTYHKKGKHQPPQYNCTMCPKSYSWRSSLNKHKQSAHRNEIRDF